YSMDARADVDMNVVMTGAGNLVEVQGTAEGNPFNKAQLDTMLEYALQSLPIITDVQRRAVEVKLGASGTTIEAK
ncbi:MAG TPA: ribonuclease PH, partial [Myxococcota bacterium]|nr:ribonuclease PH [Myxococcota bacterium]